MGKELSYHKKEKRGEVTLFTTDDNHIIVSKSLQNELMEWYYINLKHPSSDRIYLTLKQYFYWKDMKDRIKNYVKHCKEC